MKNISLSNKTVSIGGRIVITDWRNAKIISPENLNDKIRANESAKNEIGKQTKVPQTSNILVTNS